MIYQFNQKQCLNGWWDFLPVYSKGDISEPPEEAWLESSYLVPSWFNQTGEAFRYPGEEYYRRTLSNKDGVLARHDADNLFNAMDYPNEWNKASAAWARRTFEIHPRNGKRYFIIAEGTSPKTTLYINGIAAAAQEDPFLPMEADVTEFLRSGENLISFLMEDYRSTPGGKRLWPAGNKVTKECMGIWQDVYLVEKNEVYLEDVTIVTSVRDSTISLCYSVINLSDSDINATIRPKVTEYPSRSTAFNVPLMNVHLKAHSQATTGCTVRWENPKLWDNFEPNLYWLESKLYGNDGELDEMTERFGFREVWIDGCNLMLNGHIQRLYYDWGHKVTQYNHTEGWIRKWFGMIRDFNLNGSRLHTHPHPKLILDLADEHGIFITGETGIHGSGKGLASDRPEFWEHAKEHVVNFIKRDKNHPCVLLWSCENEMRYNLEDSGLALLELPEIRRLFESLDPTRPAYHEGDSSLWDETQQPMISRHYYKVCSGIGWWDKKRPLHCGEMGKFHYQSPLNTVDLAGDSAWADYRKTTESASLDATMIIEDARANDVCCLGPWNISCLLNLRSNEEFHPRYKDFTESGPKPLHIRAGSCEFEYWEDGCGYVPQPGTLLLKNAFRPFAVIDTSRRTGYFAGRPISRELNIVNDTSVDVNASVRVMITKNGKPIVSAEEKLISRRGTNNNISITLPSCPASGKCKLIYSAFNEKGETLDIQERTIWVENETPINLVSKTAVFGNGSIRGILGRANADYRYVDYGENLDGYDVLIIEKNTVAEGTDFDTVIRDFADKCGRVLVLEQEISPFVGLELIDEPVQTAFIRNHIHPALHELEDESLRFWSDHAYSDESGDSFVAKHLYKKDDCSSIRPILDTGTGEFGTGNYEITPLFEVRRGNGLVIACQMEVTEKSRTIPAASRLLWNLLSYADRYEPKKYIDVMLKDARAGNIGIKEAVSHAYEGGTSVVWNLGEEAAAVVSGLTGTKLILSSNPNGIYNGVKSNENEATAGIHNSDLCGISRFQYMGEEYPNLTIADLAMEPVQGIEPLVETIPKSAMRELYIQPGKTEMLRSYTVTRYCYENPESRKILVGQIPHGKGHLYVSTFTERDELPRTKRLRNQLLMNLGAAPSGDIFLSGGPISDKDGAGGIPREAYFLEAGKVTETYLNELLGYLRSGGTEEITIRPDIKSVFERKYAQDGEFRMSRDTVYIYYPLYTPVKRKILNLGQEIPDPLANTYLRLAGNGNADLWVNGEWFGSTTKDVRFSEIGLHKGWNHILLRWFPGDTGVIKLLMQWENINGKAEDTFLFSPGGN